MKKLNQIIFFFLMSSVLAFAEFPNISVKDLKAAIDSNEVVIIDVNGPKSFKNGHIPGAINYSEDSKNLAKLLPADKKTLIVSYCGGPACRAYLKGANAAAKLGYSNIKHLAAGISGWKKAGQEVERK
jgi:rhodanese-related sulfurtransferase